MNTSKKLLNIAIIGTVIVLGGCGSTPKVDVSGKTLPSNVSFKSKKTIEWDTSESFALNVSQIGRPADLGIGLRDSDNPTSEKIDKDSNSLFSFYSGYVVGGVLGGFGSLSMDSLSEKARTWRPYFLQTIQTDKITDNSDVSAFMNPLTIVLNETLSTKFNGSYVIGSFYSKGSNSRFNNMIAISGEFCELAARYDTDEAVTNNPLRELKYRASSSDVSEINQHENACYISLESNVVGEYKGDYVVAHTISSTNIGVFFGLSLTGDAGLPTVFPNEFIGLNINNGSTSVYTFDAPFVIYKGENYFFDKNETSTPL